MLDSTKKKKIDDLRDLLVGVVPNPIDQAKQISIALVYKFMNDQDQENIVLGGKAIYFSDHDNGHDDSMKYSKYAWHKLMDTQLTNIARSNLYAEMLSALELNQKIPGVFQHIFKGAFLSYRNPETLTLFLRKIGEFDYNHDSEQLGDAFEYLLSILGSQGQAGQFRTPRHVIDFIVQIMKPTKQDTILDPACGTAGFLISAFQYIEKHGQLEISERSTVFDNICGYDITPDMVKFALVNLYLHGDKSPHIYEYDTLSSVDRWHDKFTCILANPPFMTPKGGIKPHAKFRIAASKSEVLFVDYILEHLHLNGRAAIIVPEGVIFQTAKAYQQLRKMLVDGENGQGNLVAVISLPSGVFKPYSGVKTSILIIDKLRAKTIDKILLVKINNDGFDLGDKRNAINANDLPLALTVIEQHLQESGTDDCGWASAQAHSHAHVGVEDFKKNNVLLVDKIKLAENDYNLSFDRYKVSDDVQTSSYPMVKLGDLLLIKPQYGSGASRIAYNNEVRYVRITDIENNGILKNKDFVSPSIIEPQYFLKYNDILIARSGSVGRCYIHKKNDDIDYQYAGYLIRFVLDQYKVLPDYFFAWSQSEKYYEQVNIYCKSGTISNINAQEYSEFYIPLPPLEIQKQIVNEIEQSQKIIDGAKQIIDNYKPKIDIDPSWEKMKLREVITLSNNKFNPLDEIIDVPCVELENGTVANLEPIYFFI